MPGQVDLRVHDRVALDEIELYSEVLSAVAASDKPLTYAELDLVLGLRPAADISSANVSAVTVAAANVAAATVMGAGT
ncbi:MAG TPA: hypothetical protein VHY58_24465 [Streptosporangiaceae bacterium]|jgi:hypothetical protein|nr:hypothetical protein [Streptosporangiaceae bacterium]